MKVVQSLTKSSSKGLLASCKMSTISVFSKANWAALFKSLMLPGESIILNDTGCSTLCLGLTIFKPSCILSVALYGLASYVFGSCYEGGLSISRSSKALNKHVFPDSKTHKYDCLTLRSNQQYSPFNNRGELFLVLLDVLLVLLYYLALLLDLISHYSYFIPLIH